MIGVADAYDRRYLDVRVVLSGLADAWPVYVSLPGSLVWSIPDSVAVLRW